VAEYSSLEYLNLYPKHIILSSNHASETAILKGLIVGALVGGRLITKISSLLNWSILFTGTA